MKDLSYAYFDSFNEWLSSFPSAWIEHIHCDLTYPVVKLKECLVIHQTYGLPGRDAVDEEYFLVSPNNKILEYNLIYSKYKNVPGSFVSHLISEQINPWKNIDVVLDNSEPAYFHAAKPNYGHAILDCLPDILVVGNHIAKNNGRIYTGINPDNSLMEALQMIDKDLTGFCVTPQNHGIATQKTWRSFRVRNMILPPHRSRTEKVDYLKKYFIPRMRGNSKINSRADANSVFIQREKKARVKIDNSTETALKAKGFQKIDATQLSLQESFDIFSNAAKIIISFGAETANLIFSDNALIYLLVDAKKMTEPLYLNALTDTILSISNSRLSIIPLESDGEVISSSGLADSKLILSSLSFI